MLQSMIDGHDSKSAHLRTSSRSPSSVLGHFPQPCDATHHTTRKTRTKFRLSLLWFEPAADRLPGTSCGCVHKLDAQRGSECGGENSMHDDARIDKSREIDAQLGLGCSESPNSNIYSLGRITPTNTNPRIVCLMRREVAWPTPLLAQDLIGGPGWRCSIGFPGLTSSGTVTGQGVRLLGDLRHGSSREAALRGAPIADLDGPRTENVKIWSSMFTSPSTSQSLIRFSKLGHQRASASLPHLDQLAKARILFSSTRRAETY
jgi:hypothetical protein